MEDAGLLRTQVRLVHPLQGSSGLDLLLLLIIIELGLEFFLHQCRNTWFSWASSWPPPSWPSSFQLLHQDGLGSECLQQRFLATFHHKSRHLIVFIFTFFSTLVASSPPSLGTGLSCWSRVEKLLAWALRYMVDSWILVNSTLLSNNLLYSLHPRSSSTSTSGPGPGTSRGISGTGCSRTSWGHTWRKRQNQN